MQTANSSICLISFRLKDGYERMFKNLSGRSDFKNPEEILKGAFLHSRLLNS